jgi:hypothetical protein
MTLLGASPGFARVDRRKRLSHLDLRFGWGRRFRLPTTEDQKCAILRDPT